MSEDFDDVEEKLSLRFPRVTGATERAVVVAVDLPVGERIKHD